MKILFLAPQPFFVERGTPIAVKLALRVLASRSNAETDPAKKLEIDLLTYHEGRPIDIAGVNHYRISAPRILRNIGPGISLQKVLCDLIFLVKVMQLVWRNRKAPYVMLHAVEEAVFIALLVKSIFGIPYIYDMDSNLAGQAVEKWAWLRMVEPALRWFERVAVRCSLAVVPVCDSLAKIAVHYGSREVSVLRDVSLLTEETSNSAALLRQEIGAKSTDVVIMYIGNLEAYQGIDLLVESFDKVAGDCPQAHLVVVGGAPEHVASYRDVCSKLGIAAQCHFIGARPISEISSYIMQADILASPRTQGNNTPMKVYSYLHSGRAIIATKLETNTQVLSASVAELRDPVADDFAKGILSLIADPEKRRVLGANAKRLAEERYTFEVFTKRLNLTYDRLLSLISPKRLAQALSK